jgi:hypothetical protein
MTLNILALDLGDTTGWTRAIDGSAVSGIVDFSIQINEHPGARWPRVREQLRQLAVGCTRVAWEKIISGGFGQGGFAKSTLYGLECQVVEVAAELGLEPITVAPTTLKKFATGSGKATKDQMRDAGRKKWPGVTFPTHDAIDARWIFEWARKELGA